MSEIANSVDIWLPGALMMISLVMCSAFFSASETAFFFLTREQIRRFEAGSRRERIVADLMANPDRLLTAVLFWNLLINLTYFSVGVVVMHKLSSEGYGGVAALAGFLNLIGMIVFGEVVPKSTAVVYRQKISTTASLPLAIAVTILDPVIPTLGKLAQVLRRSLWPHVKNEAHLQPEDLERAIDASVATTSELLEVEHQVLHNILDLNEIAVEEVMRPRNMVITVTPDQTLADCDLSIIKSVNHLLLKEDGQEICTHAVALSRITSSQTVPFRKFAEEVVYVPWCSSLAYVLAALRNRYRSVAVVVHEHGEMVGIVTYEDLLETVFSNSPSRTRRLLGREPVIEIGENRYHAEGLVTLRYLFRYLRIPYDADDDNQNTLAGLFHEKLEKMPDVGDQVVEQGWIFTAITVTQQGQVRALIEPEGYSVKAKEDQQ